MNAVFGMGPGAVAFDPATPGKGASDWVDGGAYGAPISIVFQGAAVGDTFDVRVSNAPAKPDWTDLGVIYGAAISADGIVKVAEAYRWIRVRRTASSGVTAFATAYGFGHRPPAV